MFQVPGSYEADFVRSGHGSKYKQKAAGDKLQHSGGNSDVQSRDFLGVLLR